MVPEVTVDPAICPFCDSSFASRNVKWLAQLPRTRANTLIRLLEKAWENSISTPRASNPHGRTCVGDHHFRTMVCLQHRYETEIVPLAVKGGWPVRLYFGRLRRRLGQSTRVWQVLEQHYATPWASNWLREHPEGEYDLSEAHLRYGPLVGAG